MGRHLKFDSVSLAIQYSYCRVPGPRERLHQDKRRRANLDDRLIGKIQNGDYMFSRSWLVWKCGGLPTLQTKR